MARKFFTKSYETCNVQWTIYGSYCEDEIRPEGDVRCYVHDVTREHGEEHMCYNLYEQYIEPKHVVELTKEEFESAVAKIRSAEDLWHKADKILESLL